MRNELYVALAVPAERRAPQVGLTARLLVRARPGNRRLETAAGLEVCTKLGQTAGGLTRALRTGSTRGLPTRGAVVLVSPGISRAAAERRGAARAVAGRTGESGARHYAAAVRQRGDRVPASRPAPARAPCSASRSIRPQVWSGMFNRLLSAPFPLVLTQSFAFLSRAAGQALLQRQCNRMANAGDFAVSQAAQLQRGARRAGEQRVRLRRPSLLAPGARGNRVRTHNPRPRRGVSGR